MDESTQEPKPRFKSSRILNIFFAVFFLFIFLYYMFSAPVWNQSIANRQGVLIHINPNESLSSIADELETKQIVRQAASLKIFVTLLGAGRQVPKGDYLFKESSSVWSIAWRLARGIHGVDPIKVTFKEGATNEEMTELLGAKLSMFRKDLFMTNPKSKQGYLFPDTYFFFSGTTADEIVDELSTNFDKHIRGLKSDLENSKHNLNEIIVMASLIQKEAKGESDSVIVSGILWNRISKGMPLQVDVYKDTYTKQGLPLAPIANPGIVAIRASLNPENSPYLYYLHDKDGMIHLARTYDEHKRNISKYLK